MTVWSCCFLRFCWLALGMSLCSFAPAWMVLSGLMVFFAEIQALKLRRQQAQEIGILRYRSSLYLGHGGQT